MDVSLISVWIKFTDYYEFIAIKQLVIATISWGQRRCHYLGKCDYLGGCDYLRNWMISHQIYKLIPEKGQELPNSLNFSPALTNFSKIIKNEYQVTHVEKN